MKPRSIFPFAEHKPSGSCLRADAHMADTQAWDAAVAELEALPIVTPGSVRPLHSSARGGVTVTIRCPASCKAKRYAEQREFSKKNDTLPKCATSLLELLCEKHGSCIAEAQAAADAAAADAEFDESAFGVMMGQAHANAEQRRLDIIGVGQRLHGLGADRLQEAVGKSLAAVAR